MAAIILVLVAFAAGVQSQTPPPAQTATPRTDTDRDTPLVLLDRIEALLDAAVSRKPVKSGAVGTSGSNEGGTVVTIDRATLDEIRAEIAQIKLMLQDEQR